MSQDFRKIFYYSPQHVDIERYAREFGMHKQRFRAVGKDCTALRGMREGIFWRIAGHPEHLPDELDYLIFLNGFELVIFDDSYHREYYHRHQ